MDVVRSVLRINVGRNVVLAITSFCRRLLHSSFIHDKATLPRPVYACVFCIALGFRSTYVGGRPISALMCVYTFHLRMRFPDCVLELLTLVFGS